LHVLTLKALKVIVVAPIDNAHAKSNLSMYDA